MKKVAVLYHYPCPDGAFAALAAHLYFSATCTPNNAFYFPNTVYNPLGVDDVLHFDDQNSDVYLLDFVGPSGFVQELSLKARRVIILDHHKTAVEMLGNESSSSIGKNIDKLIDMERSGATIAFDYFKAKLITANASTIFHDNKYGMRETALAQFERANRLFKYIEDGDLWRWSLPNSKAFSSGFKDLNIEFDVGKNPSLFDQLLSLDSECIINQGLASLAHKQKLISDVLKQSYEIALGGGEFGKCLAVNGDSVSELRSELGHQLANKSHDHKLRGIGAVVYRVPQLDNDTLLKISLRSVNSDDTTPISQAFGGGGHRNASSFMLSVSKFEEWKIFPGASMCNSSL